MKKIILYFLSKFLDDETFRFKVCSKIHDYHQHYWSEQTTPGRFYDACGEFFMSSEVIKKHISKMEFSWLEMMNRGVANEFYRRVFSKEDSFSFKSFRLKTIGRVLKNKNKLVENETIKFN